MFWSIGIQGMLTRYASLSFPFRSIPLFRLFSRNAFSLLLIIGSVHSRIRLTGAVVYHEKVLCVSFVVFAFNRLLRSSTNASNGFDRTTYVYFTYPCCLLCDKTYEILAKSVTALIQVPLSLMFLSMPSTQSFASFRSWCWALGVGITN